MKHATAVALAVAFCGFSSSSRVLSAQQPAAQGGDAIAPEALAQIAALLADKQARTPIQQKIDSQLLYEEKMEGGQPVADGLWVVDTDLPYAGDGHIVVDVRARAGSAIASRLAGAGIEIESIADGGSAFRAHVNITDVESIAADPDVIFIGPRQGATTFQALPNLAAATGQGSRSSEGDVTHLAFAARGAYHINGTGVKIGVLSDGVRNLAASQAAGDLGPVTVIGNPSPCPAANTCDEGTAMLEIIHDLVPGAQLYFASAFVNLPTFADNIRALRNAGCDIIVDDVFYFVETPFQDGQPGPTNTNGGAVIQAVNDVTADGALYFSSAGNSGNLNDGTAGVWEGNFVDGGAVVAPILPIEGPLARLHQFGAQTFNVLNAVGSVNNLYWSDPLGAAANDYDLFRLNAAGTAVQAAAVNMQNGTQDPYEQVGAGAAGARLVVVKFAGDGRFLHVNSNRGRLSIPTAGQTHGHSAAASAFGVAATPAGAAFPNAFTTGNVVEGFSSDGPRRVFYQANGTPYTPGNVSASGGLLRQKPDITAADGVSVTGVGGFGSPFFGTSAAAPHAAAIAALVKSANLAATPAQIRTILTSTALDIEGPGVDRDSGAGIVMARAAVGATGATGTAFLAAESVIATDNPGNGNGAPEAGEGARLIVTLKNYGVAPATGISGTLTSPSLGITIAQPNVTGYPNLAPLASAPNASPLLFTAASDFGCPGVAMFSLNAVYGGGSSPAQVFSVPLGTTNYSITRALDGSTPPASPGVTTAAGTQIGRLFRDGVASSCGVQKVINTGGAANPVDAQLRRFESYHVATCGSSVPSCATVTLQGTNAINLFTAAYAPSFNPASILQNYKADPGSSASSRTYSFSVPGGAQTFAIDVHDIPLSGPPPVPSGNVYTLTVSGICTGSCDPPNHPPVARAKDVTVAAGPACTAPASIDDGSSDADGDPLTFVQVPPSPYSLGTTPVLLTVTDPKGAFSQASGNVTVVDGTSPSVGPLSLSTTSIWPPDHQMVDVTVTYADATDNCGAATCVLSVSSNESIDGGGDGITSPDWQVVDAHHVQLRAERSGNDSGRVYTLTLKCTDTAGNVTVRTASVLVPHNP